MTRQKMPSLLCAPFWLAIALHPQTPQNQKETPPPTCCPAPGQSVAAACQLAPESSDLSRVHRLTCAQYATAQLSPNQDLIIKNSPQTKNNIAFAAQLAAQRGQLSTTLRAHAHVYHPSGSTLFPSQSGLAASFDALIASIKNAGKIVRQNNELSYFVPLFRKVQFMVLNDLYLYLTSIYTTFNLIHSDTVLDYLTTNAQQALNKKSLIVAHLLNVIQSQMFFICSYHQPLVPKHFGLKTGSLLLQHDTTVDPLFFIKDFDQPFFPGDGVTKAQQTTHNVLKQVQTTYRAALNTVLQFFKNYTNYLALPDPATGIPGSNAFTPLAQHVAAIIDQDPFTQQAQAIATMPNATRAQSQAKISALRKLRDTVPSLNPPLFYYDANAMRAITLIPQIARQLPPNSQLIGWPSHLVKSAQAATPATSLGGPDPSKPGGFAPGAPLGYVVAYFQNAQQQVTTNLDQAVKLFINLPTVNGPYAQEIKKQPLWLNSFQGVISLLRACLGDYSQLIGMNILNPCTEKILCSALEVSCPAASSNSCQTEIQFINTTQQAYINGMTAAQAPPVTPPPTVPPVTTTPPVSYPTDLGGYLTNTDGTGG